MLFFFFFFFNHLKLFSVSLVLPTSFQCFPLYSTQSLTPAIRHEKKKSDQPANSAVFPTHHLKITAKHQNHYGVTRCDPLSLWQCLDHLQKRGVFIKLESKARAFTNSGKTEEPGMLLLLRFHSCTHKLTRLHFADLPANKFTCLNSADLQD